MFVGLDTRSRCSFIEQRKINHLKTTVPYEKMESLMLSILFYSKQSSNSKRMIMTIDGIEGLREYLKMQDVCVDSQYVRNKIMNDDRFNIRYVPFILTQNTDGTYGRYEGDMAFKWVENVVQKKIHEQELEANQESQRQLEEQRQLEMKRLQEELSLIKEQTKERSQHEQLAERQSNTIDNLNYGTPDRNAPKVTQRPKKGSSELAAEMKQQRENEDAQLIKQNPQIQQLMEMQNRQEIGGMVPVPRNEFE